MTRRNQAVDRHLGLRVRSARIGRKLSQTLLGQQLGISFQQVQKYELGKDRISASQLLVIARTLDKDIGFFFEDLHDGDDPGEAGVAEGPIGRMPRTATAYDLKIIHMLHAIDDERIKMRLFALMEAIVGTHPDVSANKADAADGAASFEGYFQH